MKNIRPLTLATMIMISLFVSDEMIAQTTNTTAQNAGVVTAKARKTIGFRSVAWQHKHIHDMDAAKKLIESLEQIGCEVIKEDHNGHLDVRFRCTNWKSITVETDTIATQWSSWLVGNGMETVIVNPPSTEGLEAVRFRKTEWKNLHLHDAAQADQTITMLKLIGCEAEKDDNNGHIDIRYRTSEWVTIVLHNHAAAHSWQEWLKGLGFETEHSH